MWINQDEPHYKYGSTYKLYKFEEKMQYKTCGQIKNPYANG